MCTFVTATINEGYEPKLVNPVFEKWTGGFKIIQEPVVALPPDRVYLLSDVPCNCGTELGSRSKHYFANIADSDLAEWQRLNRWTDRQLKRWLADLREERPGARPSDKPPHGDTVFAWMGLIKELLLTPTVTTFGVMHAWYKGDPAEYKFPVTIAEPMPVSELRPWHLDYLPARTLQEFTW